MVGRLSSCTHEKEQRLSKLRIMDSGSHDLIPICVDFPLADGVISIWPLSKFIRTYKRCGVAISRSPAFRND